MRNSKYGLLVFFLFQVLSAIAQDPASSQPLMSQLDSVVVQGFSRPIRLKDAAVAVGLLGNSDWQRFAPMSLVPATNQLPGVRMEERSPGSYRLAIRGSSLRSPFGVRNLKMYIDQLPFTDPGGNTYLNALPPVFFNRLEILKGPAGSSYGAGTGGALIAGSDTSNGQALELALTAGTYGLRQADGSISFGTGKMENHIVLHHQHSDGYRDQTNMERNFGSWQTSIRESEKASLSALVFFSDLKYQTPGGLTLAQYEEDPRQSRPAGGPFPSAKDAHAEFRQKIFYSGLHQEFRPDEHLNFGISLYGAIAQIENPTVRNFEQRSEPHYGGRFQAAYNTEIGNSTLLITGGGEWQQGNYQVNVFSNKEGNPDSLQTSDKLTPRNAILFTQAEIQLPKGWHFSGGISWNRNQVKIQRVTDVPVSYFGSNYKGEWSPRFTLSKSFKTFSLYGIVAKGFSPPTTTELLPSTSVINQDLQAEWGWNYELGLRGGVFNNRLWYDLNFYYFQLKNAIVQRRDASGADYFENAGSTTQSGLEAFLKYAILPGRNSARQNWKLQSWIGYALQPYKYDEFKSVTTDLSGNSIPGIAKQVFSAGFDLQGPRTIAAHLSYQYVDPIWLNDANTARAKAYQLVGLRIGSRIWKMFSGFAGADNLLNQTYSLGNDINATGNRFYNAAMKRNYYAGIQFSLDRF